jgi:uncharacterized membrane protein
MADGEAPEQGPVALETTRFEAFSDGVFAIAITLLILEISVPAGSEDDLLQALLDQWPSYIAYLISFATVGAIWLAHTGITHYLVRTDAYLVRINLLVLMLVSFIPFPTRLLAEYTGDPDPERVAATLYGLTLLTTAGLVSLLWRYAVAEKLVNPDARDEEVQTLTQNLTPGLAGYVAMIVLGLFAPRVAMIGYLVIAVGLLIPFGLIRHGRRVDPMA